MSENDITVQVYPFGEYVGLVPAFVAEIIELLREPATFDEEATERLGLAMIYQPGDESEPVGWSLITHENTNTRDAASYLDMIWGGQGGDVAAKFPGCPYWLMDLDVPAVRFVENSVEVRPDRNWENGTDDDFWFVEVVETGEEPSQESIIMGTAKPRPQIVLVTRFQIGSHNPAPIQEARTRTLADARYMLQQEIK